MEKADLIQAVIASILLLTFIVLCLNLLAFWKQNDLTQTLNKPICGVEQIKINIETVPAAIDVISISAVLTNSGNDYARDVVITRELFAINKKTGDKTILIEQESQGKIIMLPKQKLETFLLYVRKNQFNALVGGYDRIGCLSMTIEYKDMNQRMMKYSCTYFITKLISDKQEVNVYEVILNESNLEVF